MARDEWPVIFSEPPGVTEGTLSFLATSSTGGHRRLRARAALDVREEREVPRSDAVDEPMRENPFQKTELIHQRVGRTAQARRAAIARAAVRAGDALGPQVSLGGR